MKLSKVIAHFIEEYDKAKDRCDIHKPFSFALYYTWEWCERKEKPRKTGLK